jgi:hypothetical protein
MTLHRVCFNDAVSSSRRGACASEGYLPRPHCFVRQLVRANVVLIFSFLFYSYSVVQWRFLRRSRRVSRGRHTPAFVELHALCLLRSACSIGPCPLTHHGTARYSIFLLPIHCPFLLFIKNQSFSCSLCTYRFKSHRLAPERLRARADKLSQLLSRRMSRCDCVVHFVLYPFSEACAIISRVVM